MARQEGILGTPHTIRQRIRPVSGRNQMKSNYLFTMTLFLTIVANNPCHANRITDAVNALQKAYPKFHWQPQTAVEIDIDADGIRDTAVLGVAEKAAAVGIFLGSSSKSSRTRLFEFTRGCSSKCVMCDDTARLMVEKQSGAPKDVLEELPQGYRICRNCFEITVDDSLCDPIHIYWNHKKKDLDWWR
jgi:hypothetical protein